MSDGMLLLSLFKRIYCLVMEVTSSYCEFDVSWLKYA